MTSVRDTDCATVVDEDGAISACRFAELTRFLDTKLAPAVCGGWDGLVDACQLYIPGYMDARERRACHLSMTERFEQMVNADPMAAHAAAGTMEDHVRCLVDAGDDCTRKMACFEEIEELEAPFSVRYVASAAVTGEIERNLPYASMSPVRYRDETGKPEPRDESNYSYDQ